MKAIQQDQDDQGDSYCPLSPAVFTMGQSSHLKNAAPIPGCDQQSQEHLQSDQPATFSFYASNGVRLELNLLHAVDEQSYENVALEVDPHFFVAIRDRVGNRPRSQIV